MYKFSNLNDTDRTMVITYKKLGNSTINSNPAQMLDMFNTTSSELEQGHPVSAGDLCRGIFVTLLSAVTITVNILNLKTLSKARSFRRPTRLFLTSLSAADFTIGLVIPWYIYPNVTLIWPFGQYICIFLGQVCTTCFSVSIWMLMFLSLDRFLAIWKPLRYSNILNPRTTKILIGVTWVSCATVMSLPLVGVGEYTFAVEERLCINSSLDSPDFMIIIGVFLSPPVIFIYVWNTLLWQKTWLEIRRLSELKEMSSVKFTTSRKRRRQLMAAITIGFVVVVFSFTWLPFLFWNICTAISGKSMHPTIAYIIMWLGLSNCCLNFFIFIGTNRQFRQHVVALLKCMSAEKYASNRSFRKRAPSTSISLRRNITRAEISDSGFTSYS